MVDRHFQKLENGLSRQGGLPRRGRSRQVLLYLKVLLSRDLPTTIRSQDNATPQWPITDEDSWMAAESSVLSAWL